MPKKIKLPTKKERNELFLNHNVPAFIASVQRVRKAINNLDCALAEANLYADMIAPTKKGSRK